MLRTVERTRWEEKTKYYNCQNTYVTFLFMASAVALLIFKVHIGYLLISELFILRVICQPSWTHLQKTIPRFPVYDGCLLV